MYTSDWPIFSVTADIAVFTILNDEFCVLVIRRGGEPEQGKWALPGGFVDIDEDLLAAALRELEEETGLADPRVMLEQLKTYGAPGRDPRGRVVSVAHVAVLPHPPEPRFGSDAADAAWLSVEALLASPETLAFDHHTMLTDAVERVRAKLEYTTVATAFVDEEFTVSQLRRVYEVVWGSQFDAGNFQRKMRRTENFITPTGSVKHAGRGRPAATFRALNPGVVELSTPLTRAPAG